jgi:hypothetical protein
MCPSSPRPVQIIFLIHHFKTGLRVCLPPRLWHFGCFSSLPWPKIRIISLVLTRLSFLVCLKVRSTTILEQCFSTNTLNSRGNPPEFIPNSRGFPRELASTNLSHRNLPQYDTKSSHSSNTNPPKSRFKSRELQEFMHP